MLPITSLPRRAPFLTALFLLVTCAVAHAAGAPPPELDGAMDRLIHSDSAVRDAGLADVGRLVHPAAVPGLQGPLHLQCAPASVRSLPDWPDPDGG